MNFISSCRRIGLWVFMVLPASLIGCGYFDNQDQPSNINLESSVRVEKPGYFDDFDVEIVEKNLLRIKTSIFYCDEIDRISINSRPKDGYYSHTIRVTTVNGSGVLGGCCECANDVSLRIREKFDVGDYIYLVVNDVVYTHKVLGVL